MQEYLIILFLMIKVPWQFWIYLNGIVACTILSICAQYKIKRYYDKKKEQTEFEAGEYIKNEDA